MNIATFFSGFRLHRLLLLLGSGLAVLACIVLHNQGVLPLDLPTFLFFSFVLLLFTLYRLGWAFLFFVMVLPLEIVNLAPVLFGGIALRPYQWLAGILFLALVIRFVFKRLPFRLFELRFFDMFPVFIALGAFLSVLGAPTPGTALKQAVVVASFVGIYFLGRIFFRTLFDIKQALPFFLLSSIIVFLYALWQNITFMAGGTSFEIMPGRPNATFTEADWLGFFGVVALGVAYSLVSCALRGFSQKEKRKEHILFLAVSMFYLVLVLTVLIMTVARSAWLGALLLTSVFVLGHLFEERMLGMRSFRKMFSFLSLCAVAFGVAALLVLTFHLSPFQFWNRIQSTGSGLQKITVSCLTDNALPEHIQNVTELPEFGCQHIDLEVIEKERSAGRFIKEVFRPDPNVSIRQEIYGKVWGIVKEHPFLGIGWGNAALFLGTDESGTGLNASNIFFEVWLGSGLLGLVAFVLWWFYILYATIRWYREAHHGSEWVYALSLISIFIGTTVFNLFNSGILLGFFFLLLSLSALSLERLPKMSLRKPTVL